MMTTKFTNVHIKVATGKSDSNHNIVFTYLLNEWNGTKP